MDIQQHPQVRRPFSVTWASCGSSHSSLNPRAQKQSTYVSLFRTFSFRYPQFLEGQTFSDVNNGMHVCMAG